MHLEPEDHSGVFEVRQGLVVVAGSVAVVVGHTLSKVLSLGQGEVYGLGVVLQFRGSYDAKQILAYPSIVSGRVFVSFQTDLTV